jgi:LDH2 family malate/lactate/ureidoglycolate dehydrogenase
MFIAINIADLMPVDEFGKRADELISRMKNAPKSPGVDRIYVPGEMECEAYDYASQHGVALAEPVINDLRALGAEAGVAFPG